MKSSLQLMKEAAAEKTIAQYAELCGVDAKVIENVAKEFTSHGKKAAVDVHRGPAQHTNGFYNISSLMNLNLLVGNFDWAGGMIAASTWNVDGTKTDAQPFSLKKLTPKTPKPFGLSVIRHDAKYEESTLFKAGYPAKRNWWPLSSDVYEEILPSIQDAYPYPVKVVYSYMAAATYSLPAGQTNIKALQDLERVPLYFANDITVGPTSMYADYVFPDLHYLERWEMQGSHPNMPVKSQPVRNPVIASPNETVKVFGEEQPISYETLWLALAERLGLPGFGKDGFAPGPGSHPAGRLLRPARRERRDRREAARRGRDRRGGPRLLGVAPPPAEERLRRGALGEDRGADLAQGRDGPDARRPLRHAGGVVQGRPGRQQVREAHQPVPGEDGQGEGRLHREALLRPRPLRPHRRHARPRHEGVRGRVRPAPDHEPRRPDDQVADDHAAVPDRPHARERDLRERARRPAAEAEERPEGEGGLGHEPRGRLGSRERQSRSR